MKVKEIVYLVLLIIVVGAGVFGLTTIKGWYEASKQNEQRGRTLQTTSGILGDGEKAAADRVDQAEHLGAGKAAYQSAYQGAMDHEPEVAARAERRVADGVRQSFRARRLARERFGCVGDQCTPRPGEDTPAER